MTTWLSNPKIINDEERTRGGNRAVFCAGLALLVAIALYLVMSGSHQLARDAAVSVSGP